MPTKKKSKRIPRRTIANRIRVLADKDIHGAILLAKTGHELSAAEQSLNLYLHDLSELLKMKSGKKTVYESAMQFFTEDKQKLLGDEMLYLEKRVATDRERFSKMFIAALDARDSEKFFEWGRAIEKLKSVEVSDRIRADILTLKRVFEITSNTLTVNEVAEYVGWYETRDEKKSTDGLSQLRKLCKELKYPLKPSRQIRRK